MHIAHIINPFIAGKDSDLYKAQPITFETMRAASEAAPHHMKVELFAAYYPGDEHIVPGFIKKTPPLDRSVQDIGSFANKKPLPLLKDILDRLYQHSDADYFVYSNVDIALTPQFYEKIGKIIEQGYDGFVINRRTISDHYSEVKDIPKMLAEVEKGKKHPGYDCFIFKREAYQHYRLGTSSIGANWIGRVLTSNIMAFAKKFKIFEDLPLTFHIGDDRVWMNSSADQLNQHNEKQLLEIFDYLTSLKNVNNRETLNQFYMYNLKCANKHPNLSAAIIAQNAPSTQLPAQAKEIYPDEFRYSSSWNNYPHQWIRQDPVFIVGYPRSGTTLIQALLATQENTVSFYESHFFSIVRRAIIVEDDHLTPDCLDQVFDRIRERLVFSKEAEAFTRKQVAEEGMSVKMLFETIVIDNLVNKIDFDKIKSVRWIEKTPDHVFHLDVIHRFYPQAKFIYVMRSPEKAILSRRLHFHFNDEANWPIEKHVNLWLRGIQGAESFQAVHPGSLHIIRLEDVTSNPSKEIKKVCEFAGIPFSAKRLDNYKEKSNELVYSWETWKKGASQDISPAMAKRKNKHLSPGDKLRLSRLAGKVMHRYGYHQEIQSFKETSKWMKRATMNRLKRVVEKSRKSFDALILPRFKTYSGKINMTQQLEHFYGKHRSGWIYAISCLAPLHHPRGVFFDAFIERTFAWRGEASKPYDQPWIGFIHVPPKVPEWFQGHQSNEKIFQTPNWQKSMPFCKGLYTLSAYHREYLESKIDLPINSLLFPTETPAIQWSWEKFEANEKPKVIQIGWWLRKIHSIFMLEAPNFQKIFLKVNYFNWDHLIQKEREILKKEGVFKDEMYDTVETVSYLEDSEYDQFLSENIVCINLYDSSANNTVIECIVRNTPLLVNPLPSVMEYLGEDYPFYFNSLEEATAKLADKELIKATHDYLVNHPIKEKLTGDYFRESLKESPIYKSL